MVLACVKMLLLLDRELGTCNVGRVLPAVARGDGSVGDGGSTVLDDDCVTVHKENNVFKMLFVEFERMIYSRLMLAATLRRRWIFALIPTKPQDSLVILSLMGSILMRVACL